GWGGCGGGGVGVGGLVGGLLGWCWVFFFFQAEDGIRDRDVTGVQTCALPISRRGGGSSFGGGGGASTAASAVFGAATGALIAGGAASDLFDEAGSSGRTARSLMIGSVDFALALVTLAAGSVLLVTAGSGFGEASAAGFAAGFLGAGGTAGVLGIISAILSFSTRT